MSRTIASSIFVCLSFLVLAFVFPVGLYPFQDEFRDFFAFIAGTSLISLVLFKKGIKLAFPLFLVFLPLFAGLLVVIELVSSPRVELSFNWYYLAFLFCAMTAIAIASLAYTYGASCLTHNFALFLLAVFIISAFFGLLRFYGVLGAYVPLVTTDGSRLLGPMGQPNLMAVLSAISLSAIVLLLRTHRLGIKGGCLSAVLIFYVGALTASRSWYIAAVIALFPLAIDVFRGFEFKKRGATSPDKRDRKFPELAILVLFILVSYAAPKFDAIVAGSMIESGFLERSTSEEVYQAKSAVGTSGRLTEWTKAVLNLDRIENVLIGYGPGRYGTFSNEVSIAESQKGAGQVWNNSHNIFINMLVELGVFGLILIFLFFSYIAFRILVVEKKPETVFLISVVSIFLFHSLVEFSLWYLPFFALFICALALLDVRQNIDVMSILGRRAVTAILLFVFLPLGFYVGKDIYTVIRVMYKEQPGFEDQLALRDAYYSSLVGHGAYSVRILRFSPPTSAIEYELEVSKRMVAWRPEPLFKLRHAVLLAAAGQSEKACEAIEETIMLYPDAVNTIQDELAYLESKNVVDASEYSRCVALGVGHWVE